MHKQNEEIVCNKIVTNRESTNLECVDLQMLVEHYLINK